MGLPEESKGREFPRLSFPTDKRSGDSNALLKVDPKRLEHVTLLLRLEFLSNRGAVAVPAVLGEAGPVEPPTVPEPPDLTLSSLGSRRPALPGELSLVLLEAAAFSLAIPRVSATAGDRSSF